MFGSRSKDSDLEFFTIYDSKTKSYNEPSMAMNRDDMLRILLNIFRDPNQSRNRYFLNAEDYSLFRIGSFDMRTGKIEGGLLEHVANLNDLRAMVQVDRPGPGIVAT